MDEPIRETLEAIDAERDVPRLMDGAAQPDRSYPAALAWLRRWRPARAAALLPDCSCAAGRCVTCN